MVDWDDFGYEPEVEREPDEYEVSARNTLEEFFETNDSNVFFGNQLAVQNEKEFFHWITHRALADLIGAGLLLTETRQLTSGGSVKARLASAAPLLQARREPSCRVGRRIRKPVDVRSNRTEWRESGPRGIRTERVCHAGGTHAEVPRCRVDRDRAQLGLHFRTRWPGHGIEKNTLSYMQREEFEIKLRLCKHLGLVPLFAARMLPKSWIKELIEAEGYAMIMKYQLYPWTHAGLAKRVAAELGLPIDTPKALADGTMNRFERWHREKL